MAKPEPTQFCETGARGPYPGRMGMGMGMPGRGIILGPPDGMIWMYCEFCCIGIGIGIPRCMVAAGPWNMKGCGGAIGLAGGCW